MKMNLQFYRYLRRTESSLEDEPFEVENTVDKRKSVNLAERVSPMQLYIFTRPLSDLFPLTILTDVIAGVSIPDNKKITNCA